MNIVTDAAAWLRRKLGIRQSLKNFTPTSICDFSRDSGR